MKIFKKVLAIVLASVLMLSCMIFSTSAEDVGEILWCTADLNSSNIDGGAFASGIQVAPGDSEHEIVLTENNSSINRCLWAFLNTTVEKYPYLYIELENPDACQKITISKHWDVQPEIELEIKEGLFCVNYFEMLKDWQSTLGYSYVVPYVNIGQTLVIKQMYLSNVDENGNIYVAPTQPRAPWMEGGKEIRFDLPAYDKDNLYEMVNSQYGYGWLMTTNLSITDFEDGKGFYAERKEGSTDKFGNIAWVVPYEQLEKTPYLVFDFGNTGRPDEGPQVSIYAYWEGMTGSLATFDNMEVAYHGANGLNGVSAFNLKFAVDEVNDDLKGPYGIAIIVALNWSDERTDGTVMDQLKINDAYLMGWEGGTDTGLLYANVKNGVDVPGDKTSTSTLSQTTTTTAANNDNGNDNTLIVVVAVVAAVVVIGAVVAVVVIKKKKK